MNCCKSLIGDVELKFAVNVTLDWIVLRGDRIVTVSMSPDVDHP